MGENSLGKLALESCGVSEEVKKNWKYYIDNEVQKNEERLKIEEVKIIDPAMGSGHMLTYCFDMLREVKKNWKYYIDNEVQKNEERLKIEEVKIIDPAMGSGHMLTYCFDMLSDIYEDLGWSKKDAVLSIIKNNIYGLEISWLE